ncbi:MAG: RagB/SusD family nutrient uptake outer membrane protein [Balneolaceae bacterium]|nr:RagB/SusD family nutrient uptake outer membrane protein [Balneolaceae bacterium]
MKKLSRIILVLGLFVMAQACNSILEEPDPSTSISQELALSDEGAVEAVRASMYSRLHSFAFTTRLFLGPDVLADNSFNRAGTSRFESLAQNALRAGLNGGSGTWNTVYNLINDANLLISGIEEGVIDQSTLDQFRGEAFALRAYAMHYLVKVLGYEPGVTPASGPGAGFNLGIIIRTSPVLDVADADERARSTVSEVYTQIISDLQSAIGLLDGSNSTNFVNRAFAQAVLARVHLYAQNYAEANQAAQDAIDSGRARLATAGEMATMFDETAGSNPESFFTVLVNPDTESQGINSSINTYTENQWNAQVPTPSLRALYDAADARNAWFAPCTIDNSGNQDCSGSALTGEEFAKWNGEKGQFTDDFPHIRFAELILIQAEARLFTNPTTTEAINRLNDLRANRGLAALNPANFPTTTDALNEILDERRRELVVEGHRFFDLKRLGRDIEKDPTTGQSDIAFENFKVLDDIDPAELEVNEQLVQNPGY